jgi:UDP-N-acetylglucosamine transferase subunit ALG13
VVCHGGTGSLITALRQGCHVIAMPRLSELAEHYDDHQSEITEAFVQRGLILAANDIAALRGALADARDRSRVVATTDPVGLIAFLREALDDDRPAPQAAAAAEGS